jgi:hypothetical protein
MKTICKGILPVVAVLILFLPSCVKDTYNMDKLSKKGEVNPSVALKIAKGRFNLGDAIESNDTIVFHSDKTISLVYKKDSLLSLDVNDIVEIPSVLPESGPRIEDFQLGILDLDDFSNSVDITLDQISNNFTDPTKTTIRSLFGSTAVFPPINPPQSGGSYNIPSFSNFTIVSITTGSLSVTITNQLTVSIGTLTLRIYDSNNTTAGNVTFTNVAANGGTQTQTLDLSGKTLTNQFKAEVTAIGTPGSGAPVPIAGTDYLSVSVTSHIVEVSSGTAVLPSQFFATDTTNVDLDLTTEKVYKLKLKTALVNYTITSGILEPVQITINLPATTINGQPAQFVRTVTYNGGNPTTGTLSLNNSVHDLTTDPGQPYNIIPFEYDLSLQSSSNQVTFLSTNALHMELSISNITLEYAEGYMGKQVETFDEDTIEIEDDILNHIEGTFELADPRVKFLYTNGFGIPAELALDMTGVFKDNSTVDLGAAPADISYPSDTLDLFKKDSLLFDKNNTEIEKLLVFPPPVKITYSGSATLNPDDNPAINNFVKDTSFLEVGLEVEIPLDFKANNLAFEDTVDIEVDPGDFDPEDLKFSKIYLNTQSWFPLNLQFQLTPYDSISGAVIGDPLVSDVLVAADVNAQGIVEKLKKNQEVIDMTSEFFQNLVDANQLIIKVILSTSGGGSQNVKILSTYTLDFQIGIQAKFSYPFDF